MSYILLSHPIDEDIPLYGNTPRLKISAHSRIQNGDSSNSSMITIHCHSGTHIDAPKHFVDGGESIADYPLDRLIFTRPVIVDCSVDNTLLIMQANLIRYSNLLSRADCLLLRTGFEKFRSEDKYRVSNPGIGSETIRWIRKSYPNIKCIGIDSISISSYKHRDEGRKAHLAAFERMEGSDSLLLIEDMHLSVINDSNLELIFVLPWQVRGVDSTPCTVMAKMGKIDSDKNVIGRVD